MPWYGQMPGSIAASLPFHSEQLGDASRANCYPIRFFRIVASCWSLSRPDASHCVSPDQQVVSLGLAECRQHVSEILVEHFSPLPAQMPSNSS